MTSRVSGSTGIGSGSDVSSSSDSEEEEEEEEEEAPAGDVGDPEKDTDTEGAGVAGDAGKWPRLVFLVGEPVTGAASLLSVIVGGFASPTRTDDSAIGVDEWLWPKSPAA